MASESRRDIYHLLAIEALLTMASAMAGSFVVLFLVRDGFSEVAAALFYVEAFAVSALACAAATWNGFSRPRLWMAASLGALCAYYVSFALLGGALLLYLAPIFFGLYIVGFWVPFNVLFLRRTSRGNRGELIGLFFLVFPVVSIFAPIIGGLLIAGLGYWAAFAGAVATLALGIALVMASPSTKSEAMRPQINLRALGGRLSLAFFGEGGQEGVWYGANALLAMTFAKEELYVGMLFALFALAGGVATVYLGRRSDRRGGRAAYAKAGAILSVPAILAAAFAPGAVVYAVAMAAANFALNVCVIFIFAMGSDRMESDQPGSVLTRELLLNTGRVAGGAACALALVLSGSIGFAFAVSAPFIALAAFAR
jgi:hypothetical protein